MPVDAPHPYKPSTKQQKIARWETQKNTYAWSNAIDYRQHPEAYRIGKGEQGVLICQPYKSEILPYWRFRTPEIARQSADKIFSLFQHYLDQHDFVGADMARKYLQMGYTRARRYANHKGGRKYKAETGKELPLNTKDADKEESAKIFYEKWCQAASCSAYMDLKHQWKAKYG